MKKKVAVTIILVFLMYSISACAWPFGKKSSDAKDVSVAETQNEDTGTGTKAQQPQTKDVKEPTSTQIPQKYTSPKGQMQSQPNEPTVEETKTKDDVIVQESQTENLEYTVKKNNTEEVQLFEIIEVEQLYNLKGKTLAALPGLIGMGNDSTINIKIEKDKDVPWRVTTEIRNGKNLVIMKSRTKLDKSASVLEESSDISEKKGKNEKQTLTVSIEEQPFLGKGKVVRLNKDKSDVSELMVGLDDPITTFMQVLVWVSTIKTIPDKGLSFRWVMNGNPLPVILRELETDDKTGVCYAIFSNNSDSFSEKHPGEKPKPIARLFFPKNRQNFTMPNEFELMISSLSVVFQK